MTPIAQFEAVWDRCALLSGLYSYIEKHVAAILQADELLRAEWVSRVSAMDHFVHELIADGMVAIFEGRRPITPAYLKFQVEMETVQRIRSAANPTEATSTFDLHVREQLGRITYQAADDIANGVRLISSVELWNEIALKLGATPAKKTEFAKSLKRKHSLIIRRRNMIAHEGDIKRTAIREPWPITVADLNAVSEHIEKVVRAIDQLVAMR
ncbi:HEPN domain-containing protein [Silvibacterium acidisoli]|uniref:HEPN domain-containing protein n=1 Tax=Acidobacteriaceae bacterium ZG23-2 TaxID=2883246 RepID=UPI00406C5DD3